MLTLDAEDVDFLSRLFLRARERHGAAALERVEAALRMAIERHPPVPPDPAQHRTAFFFPGLTAQAFHDPSRFPLAQALQRNWQTVLAELEAMTAARRGFQPYVAAEDPLAIVPEEWKALYLRHARFDCTANRRACPETTRILDAHPPGGEMALFSALNPGGHIKPHGGDWNCRLNLHLGLVVPEGCLLRVGEEQRRWQAGRCLVFDDSFEHEVWNSGQATRFILLVNVWHPELTEVEVEFLSAVSASLWRERSARHLESLEAARRVLDGQRWWVSPP